VASGAAYCWGSNYSGQLGTGSFAAGRVPGPVAGGHTFATISAGSRQTCAVTTGGAAYCWGYNDVGQLGIGTSGDSTNVPVAVTGGLTFTAIQAGSEHTCALTSAGTVYCWGDDYYGQLGHGVFGFSTVPVAVLY